MADRLSTIFLSDFRALEPIGFSHSQALFDDSVPRSEEQASQEARKWAKGRGAKIVITGTFAKTLDGISVSLTALKASSGQTIVQASGIVPVSEEIRAISTEPIPPGKAGIARAGVEGVGVPVCIYCPVPEYTDEARAAKYQGSVVLQVVVTTEGRAENIIVVKGPGMGLEERAVETVKLWKFRPAVGPDGHPVAVLIPIQVAFRLRQK